MSQLTIRQWRRLKEISVVDMAKRLGVSRPTYTSWERDPAQIKLCNIDKIANVLGISRDDISI